MPYSNYDNAWGSLTIKQCTSEGVSNNAQPIEGVVSDGLDVGEYFGGQCDFRATFTSEDLGTIAGVANIITAGLSVAAGTIAVNFQKRQALGTFAAAGNHLKLSGTDGLLLVRTITLPNGGNASATLEGIFISSDGTTAPVAINTGQSLSSEAFTGLMTLGPVSLNGTTLDQVTGVTIDTGLSVDAKHYNGQNYLRDVGVKIVRRRPRVNITLEDLASLSGLGPLWGVATSGVIYGRKRSGAGFVSDVIAAHLKITFADGIILPFDVNASAGSDAARTITVWPELLTLAVAAIT